MENPNIKVAIADDHPVIRIGMQSALADTPGMSVIGVCQGSTDLVALLDTLACDVLVTDFAMPGGAHGDGLNLLAFLKARYPALAIVVMTGIDRPAIVHAILAQGVEHIVSKADDISCLPRAVRAACVRRRYLSPSVAVLLNLGGPTGSIDSLSARELEVLSLYVTGASINDIARRMHRSKQTVSTQKVRAMEKLGIDKDADLFKYALELGLGPVAPSRTVGRL